MLDEISNNAKILNKKEKNNTFLYILPDRDNEFEQVFEFEVPPSYEIKQNWINIIADAFAEYYKNSDIYDNAIQNIGTLELVLNVIKTNDIPLVNYWKAGKVEKLNTRWLNQQI